MLFNRFVTVVLLAFLALMLVTPHAFAVDLSTYAQQQIDYYNAHNPYINGTAKEPIPPADTPTPTPTISFAYTPSSTDNPSEVELLNKLRYDGLSNGQVLLLYIILSIPFIPLAWKLSLYNTYSGSQLAHLSPYQATLAVILWPFALIIFLILGFIFIRWFLQTIFPFILRRFAKKGLSKTFLQLIFPSDTSKSAYATEQLYVLVHSFARRSSFFDQLTQFKKTYSFELVSTKDKGIRYIFGIPTKEAEIMKRSLLSFLPGIKIVEVPDYIPSLMDIHGALNIAELKLSSHFALPLNTQKALSQHDPMMYLTGNMTKLAQDELISFQVVTTPILSGIHRNVISEMQKLRYKMYRNQPLTNTLQKNPIEIVVSLPGVNILWFCLKATILILKFIIMFVFSMLMGLIDPKNTSAIPFLANTEIKIPSVMVNPYEQELQRIVKTKVDQQLFETSIRILVIGQDRNEVSMRMNGLLSSFAPMSSTYQMLLSKGSLLPRNIRIKQRLQQFSDRVLAMNTALNKNPVLSTSEIADIYHFPYTDTTKTEDMVKSMSQDLPAPLLLKQDKEQDVVFGKNTYGGSEINIGLTDDERSRHMYLIGQTGSGKSTVLFHMAKDDIKKGRGICVIDPHGDLVEDLLTVIPEERINDVVYINPFDIKYPVNINLLELTPDLDEDDLELEKELVAESVISIFRRIFQKDEQVDAHRIEYILRNTIYTAFYVKDATIFTIFDLLTDEKLRQETITKIDDYHLKNFWKSEFEKAGDYQVIKMISGVTAKIGRFLFSPIAKRILEQPHSTISFDKLLDEGKIILCNVSEGKLSEDTSQLLGTTIIAKIHLAMLKRARTDKALRSAFYLSVDEFQNFATPSFTKLLSGGRKFGLRVTIAEQSTTQQDNSRITNMILANVGTVICFKTASPVDEDLLLPQFSPLVKKGEILNLPRFHFYIKLGSIEPQEPFSGTTLPMQDKRDKKEIEQIVATSQKNYASIYVKPKLKKVTNPVKGTTKHNGKTGKKRKSVSTLTD